MSSFDKNLYRFIVESALGSIIATDSSGHIILANSQAERLFGYTRNELIGRPIEALVPQDLRDRHKKERSHYQQKPRVRGMGEGRNLFALHRDGREIPVAISLSPMKTAKGLVVVAIIHDLSDWKAVTGTNRPLTSVDL